MGELKGNLRLALSQPQRAEQCDKHKGAEIALWWWIITENYIFRQSGSRKDSIPFWQLFRITIITSQIPSAANIENVQQMFMIN